jgi:glycosyltransferase involved in cell wall biosynthesis
MIIMKLSQKKISVVIPALNEELNIGRVLQRVKDAFEAYNIN